MCEIVSELKNLFPEREAFAEKLANRLNDISGPSKIAITGAYGSGKTCFLEILKRQLKEKSPKNKIIYFSAWKYESLSTPLLGFVDAVTAMVNNDSDIKNKLLKSAVKLSPSILKLLSCLPGVGDLPKVISEFIEKISAQGEPLDNQIKEFRELLNKHKNEICSDGGNLFVFIDELDRCRPNFAVELLETFKHILFLDDDDKSTNSISYVFAFDKKQLQAIITHAYGSIDFEGYLLRIVSHQYRLFSPISMDEYLDIQLESMPKLAMHAQIIKDIFNKFKINSLRTAEKVLIILDSAAFLELELFKSAPESDVLYGYGHNEKLTRKNVVEAYIVFVLLKKFDIGLYNSLYHPDVSEAPDVQTDLATLKRTVNLDYG
jgi:hypothetical protein